MRRAGRRPPALSLVCLLVGLLAVGAGCAPADLIGDGRWRAQSLAERNGWQKQQHAGPRFLITAWRSDAGGRGGSLAVYIEGDGYAWVSRTRLSADPTPLTPTGLHLAVGDPSAKRLYLARPCQYLEPAELVRCPHEFWDLRRYAPEVVAALNEAVDREKAAMGADTVSLFGWSGGGVVAALIAARRVDVDRLVTVAANLDHAEWTRAKGVTPLRGSLNPADAAARLRQVRQVHFVGLDDQVVPATVIDAYLRRLGDGDGKVTAIRLEGFGHSCCWSRHWPELLRRHVYGEG